jgi:hypothetical protein
MPENTSLPPASTPPNSSGAQPAATSAAIPDEVDYSSLERRFGIKKMGQKTVAPAAATSVPAPKVEKPAGDKPTEGVEAPKPAPKQPSATKAKFVVDGTEIEVDVKTTFPEFADTWEKMSDPQRQKLASMWQKDRSASQRFAKAAMTQKNMAELIHALKTNPREVLSHPALGHDMRKMIEDWMLEFIETDNLDPKEKENRELKHKIKKAEEKEKADAEREQQMEVARLTEQFHVTYQKEIIEALETSGLPKTSETVKSIAGYLKQALKHGAKLHAKDVVDLVRQDYQKKFKSLFGEADAESLVAMFGEEFAEKIRKHELKKLKATGKVPEKQAEGGSTPKADKRLSKEEWKEMIRKRAESD